MASVTRYGKGFCVRYRYTDDLGREHQGRKSGFRTEAEAWEAARGIERNADAGIDINGDKATCGEIMERWFAEHVLVNLAETTIAKYDDGIERMKNGPFYYMPVRKFSSAKFAAYNNERLQHMSARTLNTYTEPLRFALKWAFHNQLIPHYPLERARVPSASYRRLVLLNDEDITAMLQAASRQGRGMNIFIPIMLAVYCGLRREEVAALKWDHIDFDMNTITIIEAEARTITGERVLKDPKSKASRRTISVSKKVMDALKRQVRCSDYVCTNGKGKPYALSSYSQAVQRLIAKLNKLREEEGIRSIPAASFQDLRHTHAALLIKKGVQPKVIQERLGHASIKITMDTYGYLMTGIQDQVAELLDDEIAV